MKTEIMKLKDIRPAKYNPRVVLKPGDPEWEALKNSLDRFGLAEPLVVNEKTGNLVSGHQRLNVLKQSGAEEAEVVLIDVDEDQEKLLNIAMNKISGDWDYEKLQALFAEIGADDIKFTGFTPEELNNLFDAGMPDWDEAEGEGAGSDADTAAEKEKEPGTEKPEALKEFNVFLSFPTKEKAEAWLKERGVEETYHGTSRNITIRMEGLEYGTGN